jgi:hypothetical protein
MNETLTSIQKFLKFIDIRILAGGKLFFKKRCSHPKIQLQINEISIIVSKQKVSQHTVAVTHCFILVKAHPLTMENNGKHHNQSARDFQADDKPFCSIHTSRKVVKPCFSYIIHQVQRRRMLTVNSSFFASTGL